MTTKHRRPSSVEKKLIGLADLVISAADRSKDPTFAIPIRALSNVSFNERKGLIEMGHKKQARSFFNVGMAKKFMQTVLVADALSELQRADLGAQTAGLIDQGFEHVEDDGVDGSRRHGGLSCQPLRRGIGGA